MAGGLCGGTGAAADRRNVVRPDGRPADGCAADHPGGCLYRTGEPADRDIPHHLYPKLCRGDGPIGVALQFSHQSDPRSAGPACFAGAIPPGELPAGAEPVGPDPGLYHGHGGWAAPLRRGLLCAGSRRVPICPAPPAAGIRTRGGLGAGAADGQKDLSRPAAAECGGERRSGHRQCHYAAFGHHTGAGDGGAGGGTAGQPGAAPGRCGHAAVPDDLCDGDERRLPAAQFGDRAHQRHCHAVQRHAADLSLYGGGQGHGCGDLRRGGI